MCFSIHISEWFSASIIHTLQVVHVSGVVHWIINACEFESLIWHFSSSESKTEEDKNVDNVHSVFFKPNSTIRFEYLPRRSNDNSSKLNHLLFPRSNFCHTIIGMKCVIIISHAIMNQHHVDITSDENIYCWNLNYIFISSSLHIHFGNSLLSTP